MCEEEGELLNGAALQIAIVVPIGFGPQGPLDNEFRVERVDARDAPHTRLRGFPLTRLSAGSSQSSWRTRPPPNGRSFYALSLRPGPRLCLQTPIARDTPRPARGSVSHIIGGWSGQTSTRAPCFFWSDTSSFMGGANLIVGVGRAAWWRHVVSPAMDSAVARPQIPVSVVRPRLWQELFVVVVVVYAVFNAWTHRFMVDDAFISLRYASNFVSDNGLVYNVGGPRVEGYTNFLWVLLQSAALFFGWNPVLFCHVLGVTCLVVTLCLTRHMAQAALNSRTLTLAVVALAGTSPILAPVAVSGIETPLQVMLMTSILCLTVASASLTPRWSVSRLLVLSLISGLALLTRLDSVVALAVVAPIVGWQVVTGEPNWRARLRLASAGLGPASVLVGSWLWWKVSYYGEVLPNTFYARVPDIDRGLAYAHSFFQTQFALPGRRSVELLAVCLAAWVLARAIRDRREVNVLMLFMFAALWVSYVVWAGGDWMGFRLMAPALPAVFIGGAWLVGSIPVRSVRIAGLVLLVAAPVAMVSAKRAGWPDDYQAFTANAFDGHVDIIRLDFDGRLATALVDAFPERDVTIAVSTSGKLPYYSGMPTIDLLGLSDRWVARQGIMRPGLPGHERLAPWSYLLEKGVNLVIPYSVKRLWKDPPPAGAELLEITLGDGQAFPVLYLVHSAVVDRAIRSRGWTLRPIPATSSIE